jgi:hypothetical protein
MRRIKNQKKNPYFYVPKNISRLCRKNEYQKHLRKPHVLIISYIWVIPGQCKWKYGLQSIFHFAFFNDFGPLSVRVDRIFF